MNLKFLFNTLFVLVTVAAQAQIYLIKECGLPYNGGSAYMMAGGGKLFFASDDAATGLEPWISDGTPAGTRRIKDIYPGGSNGIHVLNEPTSKNAACIYFSNAFYFLGTDPTHGEEIWKYDIALDSAYMLKDINPLGNVTGSSNSELPYFCIMNNILYFTADNGTNGSELWRTDGTEAGTSMVKDIYAGNIASTPAHLTKMGNAIYFTAWGENTGIEVWKSNGTDAGTQLVRDIRPGPYSSFEINGSWRDPDFKVSGNYLYFITNVDSPGMKYHYWRTNGTFAETRQLENTLTISPDAGTQCAEVDGMFYFTGSDSTLNNSLLYKSDGTPGAIQNVVTNNQLAVNGDFFSHNGRLYFDGVDYVNSTYRYGLCVSDGSQSTTNLIKSFPSGGSAAKVQGFATDFTDIYARVLQEVSPGNMDWRLMVSNGTAPGTLVYSRYGVVGGLTSFNGGMYFAGYDSTINSQFNKPGLYAFSPDGVGINETTENENILAVFPNPANKQLSISAPGITKAEISISDMAGRILLTRNVQPINGLTTIELDGLSSGCYLLMVRSEGNYMVKKFIKE